jgi:hypothetical protein
MGNTLWAGALTRQCVCGRLTCRCVCMLQCEYWYICMYFCITPVESKSNSYTSILEIKLLYLTQTHDKSNSCTWLRHMTCLCVFDIYVYVYVYKHLPKCFFVLVHKCTCMHTFAFRTCVCTCAPFHMCTCTYIHIYIPCAHLSKCAFVCMYICI